ncbi:hypothetical protein [Ralstonia pickettii]|uniref:hypothetical protein n=1 Tax=Ralstonia pickettii TaxID=329 RepID=UPI001F42A8F8|nr:hypothetical protein [Ralstonia pickettii]
MISFEFGVGCFVLGSSLVSSPAGADSLFFVLPKKSKQKKGAPEMAKDSLNLCRREGGEANSLRSDSLPSFSSLQQKFKAPSRAGYGHTLEVQAQWWIRSKTRSEANGNKQQATATATNKSLMGHAHQRFGR